MSETQPGPPFDEQRSLAELEQLLQAIQAARRKRVQASDTFDAFVREIRTRGASHVDSLPHAPAPVAGSPVRTVAPPEPPALADRVAAASARPLAAQERTAPASSTTQDGLASAAVPEPQPTVAREPDAPAPPVVWPAPRARPAAVARFVAIGAAAIVIVGGIMLARSWRSVPPESVAENQAAAPAPTSEPGTAAPSQPADAAALAPSAAVEGELTAVRRVWVRVTADGNRVLERELAPGTRVPLRADRTLTLRVGDAGAVRLSINGRDEPLGAVGQVITRTFPPPAPR